VAFSTPAPGARVVHWIWYFPICFVTSLLLGYAASLVLRAPLAERKLTIWGRSELETVEPSS